MSGGERGAREASLAIMVGGAAADLERVRPVLLSLGQRVTHMGGITPLKKTLEYAAQYQIQRADLFPAISATGNGSRQRGWHGHRLGQRRYENAVANANASWRRHSDDSGH